ncbi:MAG: hypothetical protein ACSHX7_00890 [Luteolibacter sp.]
MIGKLTRTIAIGNLFCICATAQSIPAGKKPVPSDDVRKAIEEFNRMKQGGTEKENEVTVVLEPAATPLLEKPAPIMVKPATAAPPAEPELPAEELPNRDMPEPGLEIRVESIRKGTGDINPKDVKLETSFPVKLLSTTPQNWTLATSDHAPAFKREIEIAPGTFISVKIPPHVLAAEVDGNNTFSVSEPGFDALKGYNQSNTVSAILGDSITQLDEDSKKLGNALSDLHTLLASLPKPAPEPVETPKE